MPSTQMNKLPFEVEQFIMENNDGKYAIWYHGGCNDGLLSAAVTMRMLIDQVGTPRENITVKSVTYGKEPRDFDEDTKAIFIVDFSYPPEVSNSLAQKLSGYVITIDHHASAIDKYLYFQPMRNNIQVFDTNLSGASLCWDTLIDYDFEIENPTAYALVLDVEDRDLWKFMRPNTKTIHLFLNSLMDKNNHKPEFIYDQFFVKNNPELYREYIKVGSFMKSLYDSTLRNFIGNVRKLKPICIEHKGNEIPVTLLACNVSAYMYVSDSGDYINNALPDYVEETDPNPVVMLYAINRHNVVKLSFRSVNGLAKSVAEHFDGGGHPNSGGGACTVNHLMEMLNG